MPLEQRRWRGSRWGAPAHTASTDAPVSVTVQYQCAQMHRNPQDLQACVSFVAEVIVRENTLLLLWIPVVSLECSGKAIAKQAEKCVCD